MPRHPGRPLALAALALAASVSGCSRALPTGPDDSTLHAMRSPAPASTTPIRIPDPAQPGTPSPSLPSSGGTTTVLTNPAFLVDPDANTVRTSSAPYVVVARQLVKPKSASTLIGGRWSLAVPAGAVPHPTHFTIAPATDGSLRVQFGPTGEVFPLAVELTIDYSGTSLDPDSPDYTPGTQPMFMWFDPSVSAWVVMATTNDAAHKLLHAQLSHFSTYGLGSRAGS